MNRPLRVMLVVNSLCRGGAERQLVELAKGLDRERFYPIVVTLHSGRALEEEVTSSGLRLLSLERGRKDLTTLPKFVRLLQREKADIIQPYLTPATFYSLSASHIAGTPIRIATLRVAEYQASDPLSVRCYRMAETWMTRRAHMAVPNSRRGKDDLISQGVDPARIRVIYNGVNPERTTARQGEADAIHRRLGLPARAPVIGIVARLDEEKGHETLLRSLALVRAQLPDVHLVIVGDGVLRRRLETLSTHLGLSSNVRFAGEDSNVAPFLSCFDVAVLSSSSGEGCSNFILEAMGMGKPVVATDVGGNRELVEDGVTGYLVPPAEPERLCCGILALLTNQPAARQMGAEAQRRFLNDFTREQMVKRYESLYQELWSRHTAVTGVKNARVNTERSA